MRANFHAKWTNLTFLAQICPKTCPKIGLWFEIQKTNVGIRTSILEIHVCQYSDRTDNFDFLGPNLSKNGLLGKNFKNLSLDSESASPQYHVSQFTLVALMIEWPLKLKSMSRRHSWEMKVSCRCLCGGWNAVRK